jgi:NAD(P)-dependent dehydrogenase (short-subunit alcohol dehydrogenase family)
MGHASLTTVYVCALPLISSMSHEFQLPEGGIQFGTLGQADGESSVVHYNRSKLANVLYTKALARRLEEAGHDKVFVNAVHPGYVLTEIDSGVENAVGKVMAKFMTTFRHVVGRDVEDGALTQLYCATSPEIEEKGLSGRYFVPDAHELRPSK